jgi:uncharacterized membrane protein YtjA (UPF0391 family)
MRGDGGTCLASDILQPEAVTSCEGSYGVPLALLLISREEHTMLRWALIFLIVALVAAVFGFGGVATSAAGIAKILFVLFLAVFVI